MVLQIVVPMLYMENLKNLVLFLNNLIVLVARLSLTFTMLMNNGRTCLVPMVF